MNLQQLAREIVDISSVVVSELRNCGEVHSCIFAAATLRHVLRAKGFSATYPLTVRAVVLNPALVNQIRESGYPNDPEGQEQCRAEGCRRIAVGAGAKPTEPDQWRGHLVVVIPHYFGDRHAVCDLTIPQANRPEWGIELRPVFLRVPESFIRGQSEFKAPANGSVIIYRAHPNDDSYSRTESWTNKSRWQAVADRVIAELRQASSSAHHPILSALR